MPAVPNGEAKEHRTVTRVTRILELAAASPHGVRLADIAAELDAPRSSSHGLAKGLVAAGYLVDDAGSYSIGPAVSTLLTAPRFSLVSAAQPSMDELHAAFDETVMLCTMVGDSVVYTATQESSQLIRYVAPLRTRRPLYPTSSGKCLLAFSEQRPRERYLRHHIDSADHDRVRAELERIRSAGYAINRGETLPDVCGVAAPVIHRGRVEGVLAMAGPITRIESRLDEAVTHVVRAAAATADRL